MTRIKKQIQSGWSGEPSIYLVELGKKDIPMLELKENPSFKIRIKSVKCKALEKPPINVSPHHQTRNDIIKVSKIEKVETHAKDKPIEYGRYTLDQIERHFKIPDEDPEIRKWKQDYGTEHTEYNMGGIIKSRLNDACEKALTHKKTHKTQ